MSETSFYATAVVTFFPLCLSEVWRGLGAFAAAGHRL